MKGNDLLEALKNFRKMPYKAEKVCGESLIAPKTLDSGDPSALEVFNGF